MHNPIWLVQARALVPFQFLEVAQVARQIQSMVYSKKTVMNTYKGLSYFLRLLHLSTSRPAGGKTARVVVGVHNKSSCRYTESESPLHCPLRITIYRDETYQSGRRPHDIVISEKGPGHVPTPLQNPGENKMVKY